LGGRISIFSRSAAARAPDAGNLGPLRNDLVDALEHPADSRPHADLIQLPGDGDQVRAAVIVYSRLELNEVIQVVVIRWLAVTIILVIFPLVVLSALGRVFLELPALERGVHGIDLTLRHPFVAVAPLHNLTDDPAQEYFADGLTEELIKELDRYQDLQVISCRSRADERGL
jgi:hypothetical protein